jgi:hypothetical protein
MRRTRLLGLFLSVLGASSTSAQTYPMDKNQFQLFLHDVSRDSVRWMEVVSEIVVASLKDLPYRKGQLVDTVKRTLSKNLASIQEDIGNLQKSVTLTSQLDLLWDLEEAKGSMDDLASDLDIEDPTDMDKFTRWLNDAARVFGEINDSSVKLYKHLRATSDRIDSRGDCLK